MTRTIAIASGKGGVGKTWFAITLAHALAQAGRQILLVDADLGLANVDIQLGLNPEHDLADVLTGHASLAQAIQQHAAGFAVLPGSSGTGTLASLGAASIARMLALLAAHVPHPDTILLDLGAGIEHPSRRLAAAADTLLLLITAEPTSLTDAYAVLKLFYGEHKDGDARVIVNQAASQAEGQRSYQTIAQASARFLGITPKLAGIIRQDRLVPQAIRRQTPLLSLYPESAAAADVRKLIPGIIQP